jgi:hypothetical protein
MVRSPRCDHRQKGQRRELPPQTRPPSGPAREESTAQCAPTARGCQKQTEFQAPPAGRARRGAVPKGCEPHPDTPPPSPHTSPRAGPPARSLGRARPADQQGHEAKPVRPGCAAAAVTGPPRQTHVPLGPRARPASRGRHRHPLSPAGRRRPAGATQPRPRHLLLARSWSWARPRPRPRPRLRLRPRPSPGRPDGPFGRGGPDPLPCPGPPPPLLLLLPPATCFAPGTVPVLRGSASCRARPRPRPVLT